MLAIRETGAGDALVLVHGAGTSSAIGYRVTPLLADGRRVVAPDVPGYGGSPAAGKGFALEEVTDSLVAGLEQARVAEVLGALVAAAQPPKACAAAATISS